VFEKDSWLQVGSLRLICIIVSRAFFSLFFHSTFVNANSLNFLSAKFKTGSGDLLNKVLSFEQLAPG
jgi:hypothetical protein